jgi:hypothetical protein
MPKCKNDPTKSYKGDEPSPKGLGICAHAEKVNTKKKGNDGEMWIISETKTGVKRWIKYKKPATTKPPPKKKTGLTLTMFFDVPDIPVRSIPKYMDKNPILKTVNNKVIPEIKSNKIRFFIILLPPSGRGIYWTDYASSYLEETYDFDILDEKSYIYMTVYLNRDLSININRDPIMHYRLNKSEQTIVKDTFTKYLPKNYKWDGNTKKVMDITYKK